ncbi:MAG: FAD-dependent oxidoreductase [Pseudomonadota bacterium]
MREHARVVVIGGGAVGTSILYHLTQAGISDCLLIEKDELTSGSTWHAAGNIPTYATSWLGMRAGNYAWRLYKELGDKVDSPITYRHTGAFWPAHTRDRMDLFHHLVGVSQSAGFDLAMLSPREMESMHPYYTAGGSVVGGIHDPYEGDIDPSQLTQALAKGARAGGAEVNRFTSVTGITRLPSGEWRVQTDKGDVVCEIVVNATGFYGSDIAAMVGQPVPIATLEHQYLVTDSIPALESDNDLFPLVRDPDICFYLRRERSSLLFGSYGHAGRLAFTEGVPENFTHQLFPDSVDDIAELLERAMQHIPMLGEAGVQRFVNGPIAYSPDALPLCGPAHGLPNFYHACGIQIGITHSAAVGKAIAEWVTEGETEWDLSAWDPRRFGDWATTKYAQDRIVELYGLQYAISYPHRILSSARPVNKTPLFETLKNRGAVFGQIGGWERAFWFDTEGKNDSHHLSFRDDEPWRLAVQRECEAVRDRVGVMDHGGFTKFEVEGDDATAFLDRVFCGRMPAIGRVKLSYMITPGGKIWSEATIARFSDNRYLLCGPTLALHRDFDWLNNQVQDAKDVNIRSGSERDAALMVMGPASRNLLSKITSTDLSAESMPWMSVAEMSVADCPVTAMRVSFVGELGWELHLRSEHLDQVYSALIREGEIFGIVDFGSYALNAMRIEKGYHGWGSDFGTEYTMFDAGLDKFVAQDKVEFTGKQAVIQQCKDHAEWVFAGFEIQSPDADALPSDPIFCGGEWAGYITSATTGFRIGKRIAMAYLKREYADSTQNFTVSVLGQSCRAQRVAMPFYDPENNRSKS